MLFPALKILALGEDTPADTLDSRIDKRFFDALFGTLDLDEGAAQRSWEDELVKLAVRELDRVIEATVLPDARYWRATTAARAMFFGCLKRRFPDASDRRSVTLSSRTEIPEALDS